MAKKKTLEELLAAQAEAQAEANKAQMKEKVVVTFTDGTEI